MTPKVAMAHQLTLSGWVPPAHKRAAGLAVVMALLCWIRSVDDIIIPPRLPGSRPRVLQWLRNVVYIVKLTRGRRDTLNYSGVRNPGSSDVTPA